MLKHIGTGKAVKKTEWVKSNICKVTYADLSSEELNRKDYNILIKEMKS